MDSKPAVDNVKWTRGGRYIATTFRHVIPTLEPGDQGDRGIIVELQTNLREDFTIMEKAPARVFSWLKAPTSTFTFKTLLRHYAKRALTPR